MTRLTFDKPITGIVGPNGSGKSNIADAILWVMGEQSTRTLRGGKMEDVIFGGTQRRPQLGFAEVTLILDNAEGNFGLDTSEIMLTRRYYRSGDSEYYINKSLVRLKAVTELLMDTGLGREGYSVIGQGKIAEILSLKSKDRRDVFEEAAGISRFRHRKDEAERKLQQTEDNLLRIGDIITERELHLGPLCEQAEVARKFRSLDDELHGIEISLWLRQLETLSVQAEKTKTEHTMAVRDVDAAQLALDELYADMDSLSDMSRDNDTEAESVRKIISESEGLQHEAEQRIAVLKNQQSNNMDQIESLSLEIKSQDDSNDGIGQKLSDNENRLNEISTSITEREQMLGLLISELEEISNTTGEASEAHNELIKKEHALQAEHGDKKSELSALASQAQELNDMDNRILQELADAKDEHKSLEKEHSECVTILKKSQEEAVSLENVVNGLTLKVQNRTKKADTSKEKEDRLALELKTLQSRQHLLSEMEKEFQGYSKSVRMVMQEHSRGTLKNIHGTVGGLIKTDDSYTIAIETALGSAMQNMIVDTEEDGKAAINYLKRRDGGRATFLPISTIKGSALGEETFRGETGFEGVAIDLVKFGPKYDGIYTNLLGRVIIADNLNNAIRIAKKHGHKYKIVTLDGQVMNAGGSMTGGSAVNNAGVLSRANELEHLKGRIETCSADFAKAQREYAELVREKTAAEYELNTALAELRTAQEAVMKQELELTHRDQLLKTSNDGLLSLNNEFDSVTKRIEINSVETNSLKTSIAKLEVEADELKLHIEEAIRGHEALAAERDRVNSEMAEIRTQIFGLDSERLSLNSSINDLRSIREKMLGSRERQLETITELKSKNEQIFDEIKNKEFEASKIIEEISSQKERLATRNDRKLEIEAKDTNLRKLQKEKHDQHTALQLRESSLKSKMKNISDEEISIIDNLFDKYGLSRSAAVALGKPIENINNAKKRISAIKREIDELGTVNHGAIEEYERVRKLHEELTTQRDDVVKAKTELMGIIEEITSHMSEIFSSEFKVINESFEKTFKELFGGGRASLILEDPDDVLNCGIEIQVQPPGKSLKTLTLLSGGEKAFVAIAIYFAILTVRPPPFVVMDEIDAALDDANVLRFADYMRFMSNKTQMIVISHKRGTMEEADVLYGITMQELGVSNMLCIDLDEAERHMISKVNA